MTKRTTSTEPAATDTPAQESPKELMLGALESLLAEKEREALAAEKVLREAQDEVSNASKRLFKANSFELDARAAADLAAATVEKAQEALRLARAEG